MAVVGVADCDGGKHRIGRHGGGGGHVGGSGHVGYSGGGHESGDGHESGGSRGGSGGRPGVVGGVSVSVCEVGRGGVRMRGVMKV